MTQEEYEERLHKMQRLHNELDQTFLEVNRVIPYDYNTDEVYSPRFVFMLQDASRQVDGMFKLIYNRITELAAVKESKIRLMRANFAGYYELLNSEGMLDTQKLAPKDDVKRVIAPFRFKEQVTPKWWQAYNDTKHDLPEGESFGKLGHVLYAWLL